MGVMPLTLKVSEEDDWNKVRMLRGLWVGWEVRVGLWVVGMWRPGEEEENGWPCALLAPGLGLGLWLVFVWVSKGDCKGTRATGLPFRGRNDDVGEPCLLGEDKGEKGIMDS